MPKASKKKAKQVDFEKTRTKLGKKAVASNATDTSFKARSIALPSQSVNVDKTASLTTRRRNKTIQDLLGMLRHTTPGFRKDALLGLKELLTIYPTLIRSTIGLIVPNLNRLIIDDDVGVRRSLFSFLQWYLPLVPPNLLSPYRPNLLLYTTSAMSHIYADIRMDAVRILDLLLDVMPETVTYGWEKGGLMDGFDGHASNGGSVAPSTSGGGPAHGKRVLRCYLTLLLGAQVAQGVSASSSTTTTSAPTWGAAASSDLSMQSKQSILSSLETFIERSAASASTSSSSSFEAAGSSKGKSKENDDELSTSTSSSLSTSTQWYFLPSFSSQSHARSFLSSLKPWEIREGSTTFRPTQMEGSRSDEVSAYFEEGGLVDVEMTAGMSLTTSDLLHALGAAGARNSTRTSPPGMGTGTGTPHLSLFLHLSSTLINILLDAAPSAFGPDSYGGSSDSRTELQACMAVGGLSRALWRGAVHEILRLRSSLDQGRISCPPSSSNDGEALQLATQGVKQLEKLLGHMAVYFPFATRQMPGGGGGGAGGRKGVKKDKEVQRLNLDFCELEALRDVVEEGRGGGGSGGGNSNKGKRDVKGGTGGGGKLSKKVLLREARLGRVSEHLSKILLGGGSGDEASATQSQTHKQNLLEVWTSDSFEEAQGKLQKRGPEAIVGAGVNSQNSLSAEEYASVLPIVWLILNQRGRTLSGVDDSNEKEEEEEEKDAERLLALVSLLEHWRLSSLHDEVKKQATLFLSSLLLLPSEPAYRGRFRVTGKMKKAMRIWICMLPRYLFELAGSAGSGRMGMGTGTGNAKGRKRDGKTCEVILELLRRLALREPEPAAAALDGEDEEPTSSSNTSNTFLRQQERRTLRRFLLPFFYISKGGRSMVGPVGRLEEEVGKRAVGLVHFLGSGEEEEEGEGGLTLRDAVRRAGVGIGSE